MGDDPGPGLVENIGKQDLDIQIRSLAVFAQLLDTLLQGLTNRNQLSKPAAARRSASSWVANSSMNKSISPSITEGKL